MTRSRLAVALAEQRVADRAADYVHGRVDARRRRLRTARSRAARRSSRRGLRSQSRAWSPRSRSGVLGGRFPTMTAPADAGPPEDPRRLARPRAHRDRRADQPDRDGRRCRRVPGVEAGSRPELPASVHARARREAGLARRAGEDGRLADLRLRPAAQPVSADQAGQAAVRRLRVELPGRQAARVLADRRRRHPLLPGQGRALLRARAPTRARSSGRSRSAPSGRRRRPTRTGSSTRSPCSAPPASTRAKRWRCARRTASCCGAIRCPGAARPRRS